MKVKEYGNFKNIEALKKIISRISPNVVLASGSIERKKILEDLGLFVYVKPTGAEENNPQYGDASQIVLDNVELKINKFNEEFKDECFVYPVVFSDTVISIQNPKFLKLRSRQIKADPFPILGKPSNEEEAFKMLKMLRDAGWHSVATAVAVRYADIQDITVTTYLETATVHFKKDISDDMLMEYIKTKEYVGAAGGYRIQAEGSKLFECVEGDISTVRGLGYRALYNAFLVLNERKILKPKEFEYDVNLNS